MTDFTYREQQRLTQKFLRSKVQDLQRATELVVQESGRKLSREVKKQMTSFKGNKKGFKKSVKVRYYKPTGTKPPAAIVRVGVPFLGAFEEGATVQGRPVLTILLPDGQKRGFPRVTKKTTWKMIWERRLQPLKPKLAKVADGVVVYIEENKRPIALYKIQRSPVKLPKKLSFYDTATAIADQMDTEIARLLYGE